MTLGCNLSLMLGCDHGDCLHGRSLVEVRRQEGGWTETVHLPTLRGQVKCLTCEPKQTGLAATGLSRPGRWLQGVAAGRRQCGCSNRARLRPQAVRVPPSMHGTQPPRAPPCEPSQRLVRNCSKPGSCFGNVWKRSPWSQRDTMLCKCRDGTPTAPLRLRVDAGVELHAEVCLLCFFCFSLPCVCGPGQW